MKQPQPKFEIKEGGLHLMFVADDGFVLGEVDPSGTITVHRREGEEVPDINTDDEAWAYVMLKINGVFEPYKEEQE